MVKRTYTISDATATKFESIVGSGQRSVVISSLIEDYIRTKEREELHRLIIEDCRDCAEEYREEAEAWLATDEEMHRAIEY